MIKHCLSALFVLVLSTCSAAPVMAKAAPPPPPIPATCDTVIAVLTTAPVPAGRTVVLTGTCGPISLSKLTFAPAVTLDATGAKFPGGGLSLTDVDGLNIVGGMYGPTPAGGVGIGLRRAHNVSITRTRVTGLDYGISVDSSDHVTIARNRVDFIRADSIRYFNSTFGVIDRNAVLGASPVDPAAHHPDGIQLSNDTARTMHVQITNNTVIGDAQGITMFPGSKGQFGYEDINISSNFVATSYPQGIAMYNCTGCTAKGNTINALPGSAHWVQFNAIGSTGLSAADQTFVDNR